MVTTPQNGVTCAACCAAGKQVAELFACRKAAVREFAEAECERLARVPGAAQLLRARLPLAEIAAGFSGVGAAEAHDGTSANAEPPLPSGIGFAAQRGAAEELAALEDAGTPRHPAPRRSTRQAQSAAACPCRVTITAPSQTIRC